MLTYADICCRDDQPEAPEAAGRAFVSAAAEGGGASPAAGGGGEGGDGGQGGGGGSRLEGGGVRAVGEFKEPAEMDFEDKWTGATSV
jgi:hypothetical protein